MLTQRLSKQQQLPCHIAKWIHLPHLPGNQASLRLFVLFILVHGDSGIEEEAYANGKADSLSVQLSSSLHRQFSLIAKSDIAEVVLVLTH